MGYFIAKLYNKKDNNEYAKMEEMQASKLENFNKLFNDDQGNNGITRCEFSNADEIDLNYAIREIGTNISAEEEEYFKQK